MSSPRLLAVDMQEEDHSSDTDEVLQRASSRLSMLQGRAVGAVALGLLGLAGVAFLQGTPNLRAQTHVPEAATIQEFSLFGSGSKKKPTSTKPSKPSTGSSPSSGVQWYLGKVGETCDMTCSALTQPKPGGVMECSERDFASAKGQAGMTNLLKNLKPKKLTCKKSKAVTSTKYNKASNPAPEVSTSMFSGTTCQYSTSAATCSSLPTVKMQRVCPCKKAVQQLQWRTGKAGQSCDQACLDVTKKQPNVPLYCDAKALSGIVSKERLQVALNNAHPKKLKCTAKESRTAKDTPEYAAGMLSSSCAFSKSPSTCAAVPKNRKIVRLCPCGPNQGLPDMSQHFSTLAPKPPNSQWQATTKRPTSPSTGSNTAARRRATPPATVRPSAPSTAKVYWALGKNGGDCTSVCKAVQGTCAAAEFNQKFTTQSVFLLSGQINSQCSMTWMNDGVHGKAFDNIPAQCIDPRGCKSDPKGLCAVPKAGQRVTCSGNAPPGYARMCPCQKATPGTKMQPKPYFR